MINVLLVMDHAAFRQPMALVLERNADIVVIADVGSLRDARPYLSRADVVLLDLDVRDGDASELVRDLALVNPGSSALILMAEQQRSQTARSVAAGAAGVLRKSDELSVIVDAIRTVAGGNRLLSPAEIIECLRVTNLEHERHRQAEESFGRLTPREWDVLHAIAHGMSDREMAERFHLSRETVRTHVVNLLNKLDVDSRLKALVLALRHGAITIDSQPLTLTPVRRHASPDGRAGQLLPSRPVVPLEALTVGN